jgi:hypothetical protein
MSIVMLPDPTCAARKGLLMRICGNLRGAGFGWSCALLREILLRLRETNPFDLVFKFHNFSVVLLN